jgi:hypothetical protein
MTGVKDSLVAIVLVHGGFVDGSRWPCGRSRHRLCLCYSSPGMSLLELNCERPTRPDCSTNGPFVQDPWRCRLHDATFVSLQESRMTGVRESVLSIVLVHGGFVDGVGW